jgi:hypothetical protein
MSLVLDCPTTTRADQVLLDPVVLLTEQLPAGWIAEPSTDPAGQRGIVVFAEVETAVTPTFLIYESIGRIRVATIENDEWLGSVAHPTHESAIASVVGALLHHN